MQQLGQETGAAVCACITGGGSSGGVSGQERGACDRESRRAAGRRRAGGLLVEAPARIQSVVHEVHKCHARKIELGRYDYGETMFSSSSNFYVVSSIFKSKSKQSSCAKERDCKGFMFALHVTKLLESWPDQRSPTAEDG
jgi:hypothetical protein